MSTRLRLNREFPPVRKRPCDAELQHFGQRIGESCIEQGYYPRRQCEPQVHLPPRPSSRPGVNHVKRRHLFGLEKGNSASVAPSALSLAQSTGAGAG
jgi:hypothetical protein